MATSGGYKWLGQTSCPPASGLRSGAFRERQQWRKAISIRGPTSFPCPISRCQIWGTSKIPTLHMKICDTVKRLQRKSGKKTKFIKRAPKWRSMLGTQTSFLAADPPHTQAADTPPPWGVGPT